MRSTKIVAAFAASRLAAMCGGAPHKTSLPIETSLPIKTSPPIKTYLPTMVAPTKSPEALLNGRERGDKWIYRPGAAFWRPAFTFFVESFAAYGALMHGISIEAVLAAARHPDPWSASCMPIAAAREHAPHLKSTDDDDIVEFDRVASQPSR